MGELENYDELCRRFIETPKSLIIAPAGYGKTYTIAQAVALSSGRFLVLTHTHAGVAAIKHKMNVNGVNSQQYRIETIDGYFTKYVQSYVEQPDIFKREDAKSFYEDMRQKFNQLLDVETIQQIIQRSYSGVIIDEYQDCNQLQHDNFLKMSDLIGVHILGDDMQQIFAFEKSSLPDWERDVRANFDLVGELKKPWRWQEYNPLLGDAISDIRSKLKRNGTVFLSAHPQIQHVQGDLRVYGDKKTTRMIHSILNTEKNVLIIDPNAKRRHSRLSIIQKLSGRVYMIEAIDDRRFNALAIKIDLMKNDLNKFYAHLLDVVRGEKNRSGVRKDGLITQLGQFLKEKIVKPADRQSLKYEIYKNIKSLGEKFDLGLLKTVLKDLPKIDGCRVYCRDLFNSVLKAIEVAQSDNVSVEEGMIKVRDLTRRAGRQISGHVIGTTLLVKGLEMDCVIVINPEEFEDKNHFYVAFSRVRKRLIVVSQNSHFKIHSH